MIRRVAWAALAVVVAVGLYVGVTDRSPTTDAERVESLAGRVACPVCNGQSVRDSQAPVADRIRVDIARRVADGESDGAILDSVAASYGDEVLLTPPTAGPAALVWVIPVVAGVAAAGGLGYAFWRWRTT